MVMTGNPSDDLGVMALSLFEAEATTISRASRDALVAMVHMAASKVGYDHDGFVAECCKLGGPDHAAGAAGIAVLAGFDFRPGRGIHFQHIGVWYRHQYPWYFGPLPKY